MIFCTMSLQKNYNCGNIKLKRVIEGGNINGNVSNQIRTGLFGSSVAKPKNPSRDNYEFNDWNPSVPSNLDGNKTFTAQWTPVIYKFTFI